MSVDTEPGQDRSPLGRIVDRFPVREVMSRMRERRPVVAVVRLTGIIGPSAPLRGAVNMAGLAGPIEQAFSTRNLKAVALVINSPGGSPVQSALIFKRIRALAEEKEVPVLAFAEDVAASGGYMLACAADEIYADESSVVGSIGVITAGFGFQSLIEKLGVERRVHSAGEHKAMLDPFQPEDPEDVKRLEIIQKDVHSSFKALVKERRIGNLKGSDKRLFSGEFWTGNQALRLGLIDGIGDLRSVTREKFGEKVRYRMVMGARPWWRFRGGAIDAAAAPNALGLGAEDLIASLNARALWARFGL